MDLHITPHRQMELLTARLGSLLHCNQPYSPTQKAKIERWFCTTDDQWMASLDIRDFHSLDELRGKRVRLLFIRLNGEGY